MDSTNGFEELAHTADWALRVWAADMPALFAEAARGMNALAGLQLQPGQAARREIWLEGSDAESLLVSFLSELLYLQESNNMGFEKFEIGIAGSRLHAMLEGAPIAHLSKAIKAVTYHNLKINRNARGYETELVFDV